MRTCTDFRVRTFYLQNLYHFQRFRTYTVFRVRTYTTFRTCIAFRGSVVQRMEHFRGFFSSDPETLQRLLFFRARNASEAYFLQSQKYSD
ncbi:hypothetical protein A2U01_0062460, partial [Trifolium medium]|nr:hypothetical protein [Trifolium medium]